MNDKKIFEKAFAIISDPDKWTQRQYARNREGSKCTPTSQEACSWCSLGVIFHILAIPPTIPAPPIPLYQALRKTVEEKGGDCVHLYNDNHAHSEVVAMWRETGKREGWL